MQSAASQVGIPAPERAVVRVWCRSGPGPPSSESRLWSKAGTAGGGGAGGEGLGHSVANRKDATGFGFNNQNGKKKTKKVVQYFSCKGYYSP